MIELKQIFVFIFFLLTLTAVSKSNQPSKIITPLHKPVLKNNYDAVSFVDQLIHDFPKVSQ